MLFDAESNELPRRSELPPIPGAPEGAAWFWGEHDELGRLNLLTPARSASAAKLIRSGEVVNLNLEAHLPNPPVFGREPFKHRIKSLGPGGFDDLYDMNTQSGSQWDGFRHVGHKHGDGYVFYNNITIVGRAILLDYWAYSNKSYNPNSTHCITLNSILACAKQQNITFQTGDILLIRSGWTDIYNRMTPTEREALGNIPPNKCTFVGVEQTTEMIDFLHDKYFAAVAGDMPAFEAWPTDKDWFHHQFLLSLWGVPIGEMWDLERLAEVCRREGRWSFFLTSMPSNVAGGVGSFPNAMAIF